jgi:hypothetical protein
MNSCPSRRSENAVPRRTPPPGEPMFRRGDRVEKYREIPERPSGMPMNRVFTIVRINRPFGTWAYWDETGYGAWEHELLPRKLLEEMEDENAEANTPD